MNALEKFIAARPYGFVTAADLGELIKLHRLCQVLVRCGGCRFTCAAQDVAHLRKCIEAGGDYVRDVAITPTETLKAIHWKPEPPIRPPNYTAGRGGRLTISLSEPQKRQSIPDDRFFNEADCGGAFDGFRVTSDADPGL